MRLTDPICRKLAPPACGNCIYYDGHGFGLRVTAAGARSFVLSYRTRDGRARRLTIGDLGPWTVVAARAEANELRRKIDQGDDPLGEIQAERDAETVGELAARFLTEHGTRLRPKSLIDYRRIIDHHVLPALGRHKVKSVTFSDIDRLHRKISATAPYQANRCLAVLSKMFALAVRWHMRADNPCRDVSRNKERARERYLTSDELVRLMATLDAYPDQRVASIFRLLLLTGSRRGEVLSMRWDDVDLGTGTWIKPHTRTKLGEQHTIPLSAPARAVLASLLDDTPDASGFIFPAGRGARGPMRTVEKPWKAICKAAGLTGVRVHDLRHSYASQLASSGVGLYTIGKLLGHKKPSTTARYSHLTDDALRQATERAGAAISRRARRRGRAAQEGRAAMTARTRKKSPPAKRSRRRRAPAPQPSVPPAPTENSGLITIQPPSATLALSGVKPTVADPGNHPLTPAPATLELPATPRLEELLDPRPRPGEDRSARIRRMQQARRDMELKADRLEAEGHKDVADYLRRQIKDDGRSSKNALAVRQRVTTAVHTKMASGARPEAAVRWVRKPENWPVDGPPAHQDTVERWLREHKDDAACRPGPWITPSTSGDTC
jgi:integrase